MNHKIKSVFYGHTLALQLTVVTSCIFLTACSHIGASQKHSSEATATGAKPVYGSDNRIELVNAGRTLCHAGRSVPALVQRTKLQPKSNESWVMPQNKYLHDLGWCPGQRFENQPVGVQCSGFLIAPDRIVTAAHCINGQNDRFGPALNCDELAFIFDHRVNADGFMPDRYDKDQVYFCKRILDSNGFSDADWRIVELDRETTREPLPLLLTLPSNIQQLALDIIGHPLGLPLKAAINGRLKKKDSRAVFLTTIDAFEGNSGSPVIIQHNSTPVVIGMLSGGEFDSEPALGKACKVNRQCTGTSCSGEQVISSKSFADWSSIHAESLETLTNNPTVQSLCF